MPYSKTTDQDQSTASGGTKQTVHLNSISAMKQYEGKSPEELRWEDYQAGVKGGTGQQPAAGAFGQQPASGGFGTTPASPFGAPASTSTGFSAGFGASQPAFGAQQSSPAFGGSTFGSTAAPFGGSQPAFGQSAASAGGGLFGSTTSSPFGSTSTGFGGAFGAASQPAFGAPSSAPAFGSAAASTPAFGGTGGFGSTFGGSSAPATGGFGFSAPAFGASSASSVFGSAAPASPFGAPASTPAFGATSTPAFSFAQSTPAFGAAGSAPFGGSTPAFGGASTPAFGSTGGGLFGQTAQKSGGLFAPSSTSFGTPGAFGGGQSSAFPSTSTSLFGGTGGLSASPGTSSFALTPTQPQQAAPGSAPGVATTPYGTLPAAPQVGGEALPEHKVGLTQRPLGPMVGRSVMRPTALLTPRSITPRAGVRLRTPRPRSVSRAPSTGGDPAEGIIGAAAGGDGGHSQPDPRRLFVRDPLPSTASASASTAAPAAGQPAREGDGDRDRQVRAQHADEGEIKPARSSSGRQPSQQPDSGRRSGDARLDRQQQQADAAEAEEGSDQAANGNGSAWRRRDGNLDDDEVSELLPRLEPGSNYFLQPSLTQLAAMARDDPESLAHVANFTVGRPGVGSVRWLEEVDVRGVDVDALVRLTKGGVEVYLDDANKPPVGEGLNCAARITLLKVHKMDEATKRPTTDADAIERFTVKLKKLAARQGATFVSYQPERGEWRFDVEHFSRYGLLDDDSDEEGADSGEGMQRRQGDGAADPEEDPGGDAMLEGDESDGFEIVDGEDLDGEAQATGAQRRPGRRGAAERPLPVALPASLGLEPARLSSMRSSLFQDASSRPPQRKWGGEQGFGEAAGAPAPAPAAAAPNAWRQAKPAILPPRLAGAQGSPLPRSLSPPLALPPPGSAAGSAQQQEAASSRTLVDAGPLLGRTSCAGWGPACTFAHIVAGGSGQRIVLRRLDMNSTLQSQGARVSTSAAADRTRNVWRDMLEVHAAHSSPDAVVDVTPLADTGEVYDAASEAAPDAPLPRWRLQCDQGQQLQQLCLHFTTLCTEYLMKNDVQQGLERTCYHHEAWTWDLLRILFEALPGEEVSPAQQLGVADDEVELSDPNAPRSLAAFQRRAGLSHWLQDFAQVHLTKQLKDGAAGCDAVMAMLSGHQLAAATALAAASGDVRLAALLAQAGKRGSSTAAIQAQLQTWQDAGMVPHIDAKRLQVYQVLGGQLDAVLPTLQLPWRLALGMHLWFGQGGSTSIPTALDSFSAASRRGTTPAPVPLHAERHNASANTAAAVDINLQLLRLYAGQLAQGSEADVPALLAPVGYSPEPLDARLGWLLHGVLRAIAVLPPAADRQTQVSMVTMAMVTQLEAVGDLPEWAVYVALHLPDAFQRARTITALLMQHAPEWAADAGKRDFLLQRLGIPAERISAALALWAQAQNRTSEQLASLALAGPGALARARTIAAADVAPQLGVASRLGGLRSLLTHMQAADAQTAGPLAPYAAYLQLLGAKSHGSGDEVQEAAAQLAAILQGHTAAEQGCVVHAAFATIAAELAQTAHQVDMDSNRAGAMIAQGRQPIVALRQTDWLDEMQLASAALAGMIAVA